MAHIWHPQHSYTFTIPSPPHHSYTYLHIPPSSSTPTAPTLLFLHGFPSTSHDWRHQITHFSPRYGILAPDLLGYGSSSHPTTTTAYRAKTMAADLVALLDHLSLAKVHAIAHDFGCHLLSRLVDYHPARILSCAFLSVPYAAPGARFDLDAVRDLTVGAIGVEKFGYMRFLSSPEAGPVLDAHPESFASLLYSDDESLVAETFYPPGALEAWLQADQRASASSFVSPDEVAMHVRIFRECGGYGGPTGWYRALVGGVNEEDEKRTLAEGSVSGRIEVPVLGIEESEGRMTLKGWFDAQVKGAAPGARVRKVGTRGHWVQIEARGEVNGMLEEFLREVDGKEAMGKAVTEG